MALGGSSKMPASGRTSRPQPVTKRRHSQVDQDSDDEGPRRVVTPPFNPGFLEDNMNAYANGFQSTVFQGHDSAGLNEPSIDHDAQQFATPARPNGIIEISDDNSEDDELEDDHKMPGADATDDGSSKMFFAALPAQSTSPQGAIDISATRTEQPRTVQSPVKTKSKAKSEAKLQVMADAKANAEAAGLSFNKSLFEPGEYKEALRSLAGEIPSVFLTHGMLNKTKVWVCALHYMDQLHGVTERITASGQYKNNFRIPDIKLILAEYVHDRPQFIPHKRKGATLDLEKDGTALAKALAAYFRECVKTGGLPSSTKATAAVQNAQSKHNPTSDVRDPAAAQAEPTTASAAYPAPNEHEEATRRIRELSVADPPRGIDGYYQKRYREGHHYIQDIPTETSSSGVAASEPSAKADIRANSKKQRFRNHGQPPTKIQENISDLEADNLSRTKNQGIAQARPARDVEQDNTIVTCVKIKPTSDLFTNIKSEEDPDKKLKSIKTEASDDVDPGREIVAKAMTALQQSVKGAMSQKLDWDNVPVALFEAEMGIRRVQKAIDEAKEVVAKHGYQVKRT